jgi:ribosome-associated heat shock protein Hsp15
MEPSARLDLWLWAARFYRTRALAVAAVKGGKVELTGAHAKPGKHVHVGDEIRVRLGPYEHVVAVRALSERRGPAKEAVLLYEEDPAAKARRLALAEQHRLAAQSFAFGEGKPSKKERRDIRRFRGKD